MSNLRKKVMEILSVDPSELFTCPKCRRRFYMQRDERNKPEVERTLQMFQDRLVSCKECHLSKTAFPGETFFD